MSDAPQTVLITGVAGNLGLRLLRELLDFQVIGLDKARPGADLPLRFESIDLGEEASCGQMVSVLRETGAQAVVHLAFVIDPVRTGVLNVDRMWRINVAGTARVMEAIAVVNRTGGAVKKFIYPSSVSAYGSDFPKAVSEDYRLGGHTLPYSIHKREADEVVQERAPALGDCATYLLRPHIFTGATMQNYLVGALRGTPTGLGKLGAWLRERGTRLPIVLPMGERYLQTKWQFVHVDDVARLVAHILRREDKRGELTVLNVAGRGRSLSFGECVRIANAKMVRLPGQAACRKVLGLMWNMGISGVPAEALPFFVGSYTMDTSRLQKFLGSEYEKVMQHTVEEALADSFVPVAERKPLVEPAVGGRQSSAGR
ncbi:MAG: NAD-dependent epimerase/dehydratase family protein [Acidobacteriia bacterium]|nr:NAD-dependent epimerase/dehydratase family protein [Terriglobia bacterium]